MDIRLTGKDIKVTDAIKEYVEKKMERIAGKINKLSNKEIMTIKPEDIEAVKRRMKE